MEEKRIKALCDWFMLQLIYDIPVFSDLLTSIYDLSIILIGLLSHSSLY